MSARLAQSNLRDINGSNWISRKSISKSTRGQAGDPATRGMEQRCVKYGRRRAATREGKQPSSDAKHWQELSKRLSLKCVPMLQVLECWFQNDVKLKEVKQCLQLGVGGALPRPTTTRLSYTSDFLDITLSNLTTSHTQPRPGLASPTCGTLFCS